MGLFDKLTQPPELTPTAALGAALIYLSTAAGELDDEAAAHLVRLMRSQSTLQASMRYASRQTFDGFLTECAAQLTTAQRLYVLLNVVDFALRDGELTPSKEARIRAFIGSFGFTEAELAPAIGTLIAKNDRSVLDPRPPI